MRISKIRVGLSSVAVFTMLVAGVGCTQEAAVVEVEHEGQRVEVKVPVAFGTHLPSLGDGILYIADRIEAISDGSLTMTVHEPGELVAATEILDAVSKGSINAGYATAGYWVGKLPAAPLFSAVPFGPDAPEFLAWVYYGNGRKLWQKTYDDAGFNVQSIPCGIIAPETSGW
ncbi:MAG: C4-dicarboxylate ABC transporter, partial [Dehalococcoidia bacterium]|nr:C4-dicarboxylate ABC transporter [Dehalococcoidia bacterium]